MKITIKHDGHMLLHGLFIFWMVGEFMLSYSMVSRIALLLFVGAAILLYHRIYFDKMVFWYGVFAAWSCVMIALGYAVDEVVAKDMTGTLFLNLLFIFAFIAYCKQVGDVNDVLRVYKNITLVFTAICFVGGLGGAFAGERLEFLGINANVIAMTTGYAMLIWISQIGRKPKSQRRFYEYAVVLLQAATILLTGSRKGLLIPIIGLYVLVCFKKPRKFILYTLGIIVGVIAVLWLIMNVEFLYDVIGNRVEAVLAYLQGAEFDEKSLNSRVDFIELGWATSQKSPIFGHGLDCFRLLRGAYGTYSHSNYIEILYSLGWVGLSLYYMPYLLTVLRIPKHRKKNVENVALATAILVPYLICDYMNVTYFTRSDLIMPAMAMLLMRRGNRETEEPDQEPV